MIEDAVSRTPRVLPPQLCCCSPAAATPLEMGGGKKGREGRGGLAGRWKLTQVLITLVNADLSGSSRVRRERTPILLAGRDGLMNCLVEQNYIMLVFFKRI